MTDDLRIHLRHVRELRLCARGARAWCARHGVDWRALREEGVPAPVIAAIGDEFAQRAIARAAQEAAGG